MPLFYVKIRKNIDICNYLPIYYPAICRGWGTFSVPSLFGDSLWSHPFHAKTKTIAIDAYFIFYKRHYWHKSIVYERQNTQKEFCWESIIAISLYFNLTSPKQQYSNNT